MFDMYKARAALEQRFKEMKPGEYVQVDLEIRDIAFNGGSRESNLLLSLAGHRPETPAAVQEEMLISHYGIEVRTVDPLRRVVTYQKTGRTGYQFTENEVSEICMGYTPRRIEEQSTGFRAAHRTEEATR